MEKRYTSARKGNHVFIRNCSSRFRINPEAVGRFVHGVLKILRLKHTAISFVFVSDTEIQRINRRHLGHDWATDVLAFPYGDSIGASKVNHGRSFLGEIIVSPRQAKLYSEKFHLSFHEEFARYLCHGILHLKGYSDQSVRAKAIMGKAEDHLLKTFAPEIKHLI
ncbi:MAG: rRNA maturation RNase YbeY [Candidatus Omnitrophica bacterium]|nr:rRNA maturation RNase YbeY [Candidatus Omnitrophota bacterium]